MFFFCGKAWNWILWPCWSSIAANYSMLLNNQNVMRLWPTFSLLYHVHVETKDKKTAASCLPWRPAKRHDWREEDYHLSNHIGCCSPSRWRTLSTRSNCPLITAQWIQFYSSTMVCQYLSESYHSFHRHRTGSHALGNLKKKDVSFITILICDECIPQHWKRIKWRNTNRA